MPKTKPNEPCPCGSEKKYKKCCSANDTSKRFDELDAIAPTEGHEISSPQVGQLHDHFSKFKIPVLDMTNKINAQNFGFINSSNMTRKVCIVTRLNETNVSLFKMKCDDESDTMLIYKNNFQCFKFDTEYDEALSAIHKFMRLPAYCPDKPKLPVAPVAP